MRRLVVANWKMNPVFARNAVRLFRAIAKIHHPKNVSVVICPPLPHLSKLKAESLKLKAPLGAQNVFWEEKGAYTGEISAEMLEDAGAKYVIVGHSERRRILGETDEMINKKVLAALAAGLKVILCVGEPTKHGLTRTSRGMTRNVIAAKKYVRTQLQQDLSGIRNLKLKIKNLAVAYEPVWAIGTGIPDKPSESAEMAGFIKNFLRVACRLSHAPVLYGGSVNAKNSAGFAAEKEIDGALVGGASLKPTEFKKIIRDFSK